MVNAKFWLVVGLWAAGLPVAGFVTAPLAPAQELAQESTQASVKQLPQLSQRRIERLISDGDRLADQGDYQAALEKYTRAYQGVVSRIRGQAFTKGVAPSIFNRQQLGQEMLRLVEQEFTPAELQLMDASYKVLGLVPPSLDTTALMTTMLTEEVAGFYDPDDKRMVLIVEDGPVDVSWLERLLGGTPAFDKQEQKTTLAHELTHALQDQLYDLNAMEAGIEDDDDMLLAFSALVEGDATLLMFVEAGEVDDVASVDPVAMRATFNIMSWMLPVAGGKTFRSAPPIFRETLTFPYFQGMLFVLGVAADQGWPGVHQMYRQPPRSTEQILHPEKYLGQVDLPQRVVLPEFKDLLEPRDWQSLGGNCLGELQTGILLKRVMGGQRAAAGWDGDRYEVFRRADGQLGLVYVSVWDSTDDAEEFAAAYRRYRQVRQASQESPASPAEERPPAPKRPGGQPPAESSTPAAPWGDAAHAVLVHEDQVWVLEGFDAELTEQLTGRLDRCQFAEKDFPLPSRQ